jgi:hypothetical protein
VQIPQKVAKGHSVEHPDFLLEQAQAVPPTQSAEIANALAARIMPNRWIIVCRQFWGCSNDPDCQAVVNL